MSCRGTRVTCNVVLPGVPGAIATMGEIVVWVTAAAFCFMVGYTAGQTSRDEVEVEHGVIFQEQGLFRPTEQEWSHAYVISLPTASDLPEAVVWQFLNETWIKFRHSGYDTHARRLSTNTATTMSVFERTITKQIIDLLNTTKTELTDLQHLVELIVPETKDLVQERDEYKNHDSSTDIHRQRRGLDFLGQAIGWIAGMPTNKDFNKLQGKINSYIKTQNAYNFAVTTKLDKLLSVERLLNDRITNATHAWFQSMQTAMDVTRLYSEEVVQTVFGLTQHTYLMTGHLLAKSKIDYLIHNFRAAVILLQQHELSPILIEPKRIHDTLLQLQTMLLEEFPGYYVQHTNPIHYYTKSRVYGWREGNQLVVQISVPIARRTRIFDIYRVRGIPIPIHDNSSTMLTEITNLPMYLAVDETGLQFAELDTSDYIACKDDDLSACLQQVAIRPFSRPTCALAIYRKITPQIKSLCKVNIRTGTVNQQIREITPGKLLFVNVPQVSLLCSNGVVKVHPGCTICTFVIPCKCDVVLNEARFSQKLQNCAKIPEVREMVNLHFLARIWNETVIDSVIPRTVIEDVFKGAQPLLNNLNKRLHKSMDMLDSGRINIDRAIAEAASLKTAVKPGFDFVSLSEAQPWLAIAAFAFSLLALILTLLVNRHAFLPTSLHGQQGGSQCATSPIQIELTTTPAAKASHQVEDITVAAAVSCTEGTAPVAGKMPTQTSAPAVESHIVHVACHNGQIAHYATSSQPLSAPHGKQNRTTYIAPKIKPPCLVG